MTTLLDPGEGLALITDGSAHHRDRSGGWAFVALDAFDGVYSDSGYEGDTTISQMELYAPTQGLNYLFDTYGACNVLVYSDSEYVVKGANDRTRARRKNKAFWNWLDDAMRTHEYVAFHHVHGHSGHHYNAMADSLAGAARRAGVLARDKGRVI